MLAFTDSEVGKVVDILQKNPAMLKRVQQGDTNAKEVLLRQVLDKITMESLVNPNVSSSSASDIALDDYFKDIDSISSTFDNIEDLNKADKNAQRAQRMADRKTADRYNNAVNSIYGFKSNKKLLAIYAAVKAATNGARTVGKNAEVNANKLASAILAAGRVGHSDVGRKLYGQSAFEAGDEMAAQSTLANGARINNWLNWAADTVDDVADMAIGNEAMRKSQLMTPYNQEIGLSGKGYEHNARTANNMFKAAGINGKR